MRQVSSLFDEAEADRQVMISLLKEIIKRLGDTTVSRLLQDSQGNLFIAHQYEAVSRDDASNMVENFQSEVSVLQNFINNNPVPADPASAPTDASPAPVDQPQPTADPVAAPPAPAEQPAPADPNAQPQPVPVDPNQAPAPDATPAPDPAVQPPLQ